MNVSVAGQTLEFAYSALLGVALGVLYDLFRVLRAYIKPGRVVTAVLDVLYWVLAVCALIGFVLTVSGGQMRWYVLVGAFCGGFVYMCTISGLFFRAVRIIIKLCIRLLRALVKPLYWIAGGLGKLGRRTDAKLKAWAAKPKKPKKPKKEKKKKPGKKRAKAAPEGAKE